MALGAKIERTAEVTRVEPIDFTGEGELFCNESGSTLRFLLPVAAALREHSVFTAAGRLPARPLSPLKGAMEAHGVSFSDSFPLEINGFLKSGEYNISGEVSSQFISGLLFALPLLDGDSVINIIPPVGSKPYIDMTVEVLRTFGIEITEGMYSYSVRGNQQYRGTDYTVEGDWSNSTYFLALGAKVTGLKVNSAQGDRAFLSVMSDFGAEIIYKGGFVGVTGENLHGINIDAADIPDLVPLLATVASTARGRTVIYNAKRLRYKESDRIRTTCEMLKNLGADITATEDGMIINGRDSLEGGTVDSFNDHRIVMAAAAASAKCSGDIYIKNAHAVAKSYPAFFEDFNSLGGRAECL
jgi:3-phosphoshikimate 1-carboxyvinyltransferase